MISKSYSLQGKDFFIFNPLNVLNPENNGNTCFDFVPGNEDKLDYIKKNMIDTCCNNFYGIGLSKTLPEIILIGSNGIRLDRMNEKIFPQSIQYVAEIGILFSFIPCILTKQNWYKNNLDECTHIELEFWEVNMSVYTYRYEIYPKKQFSKLENLTYPHGLIL